MRVAIVVAAVVALVTALLWVFQRRLIYFPGGDPGVPPPGWSAAATSTDDGVELGLWHRGPNGDAPLVIVFNGNAGNRRDRLVLGSALADLGFGVMLFDYRGYGGNEGSPSEDGLLRDARAVAAWARIEYPERALLFLGESLGAAVAIGEAAQRPPEGLILRSPFTSLADAASANYFGLPSAWLLRDSYRSIDLIDDIDAPVTVIAGTADSIVPISQSRTVYDRAALPFEWVAVDGADHNDPRLTAGPEVIAAVRRLAERLDP